MARALIAGRFHFSSRPSHLVVQAEHFTDTVLKIVALVLKRQESANINRAQVFGHAAILDPFHREFSSSA